MKKIVKHTSKSEYMLDALTKWLELNDRKLNSMYETSSGSDVWKFIDNTGRSEEISKEKIKKALIEEQGYICCYCGGRVNEANSHIEHFLPKDSYIKLTYDYTNLLISCNGGTKNIVHLVQSDEEKKSTIAKQYGVFEEDIEDLYVDDKNYTFIRNKYDLDSLNKGDRVWVFKQLDGKHHHCGHKKGNHKIETSPLNNKIEELFVYSAKTGKIVENLQNNEFSTDIGKDRLNLNSFDVLNSRRKLKIDKRLNTLSNLKKVAKAKGIDIKVVFEKIKEKLYQGQDGMLDPLCFVEVAVLENRIKAI
jgi:uncharacterized protein (TIGR02646 family)